MTLGTNGFNSAWYFILIIFIMYCIMPVPLQWCLIMCSISAIAHLVTSAVVMASSGNCQLFILVNKGICVTPKKLFTTQ